MKKLLVSVGAVGLVAIVAFQFGAVQRGRPAPQVEAAPRGPRLFFKVEIEGIEAIGGLKWRGVEGLSSETEVIEFQDGDDPITRKRPGHTKYGNITLKRGYVSGDDPLLSWYRDIKGGKLEKKAGALSLVDETGAEVARYNFFECWPAKWYGPRQVGPNAVVATEKIEIAVEKIEISTER